MNSLTLKLLSATEHAALMSAKLAGNGDNNKIDAAAVEAMRNSLNNIQFGAKVVIGEGERDQAPMLYIGEKLGKVEEHQYDIAVDPLEGTTICANYGEGALSVLGFAKKSGIISAPDVYMAKIVVGKDIKKGTVSLKYSVEENLHNLAEEKKCNIADIVAVVLNRKRHEQLVQAIRKTNAKIKFIEDGDISAILSIITQDEADIYLGIGGAPEGVLSAIAVNSLKCFMEGRLLFSSKEEKDNAHKLGIKDLDKVYSSEEMASSDAELILTGVTDGKILPGVKKYDECHSFSSLIISKNDMMFLTHNIMDAENHFFNYNSKSL